MKKLINLISEEVTKAFVSAGYDEKYGKVTLSNRPDLCAVSYTHLTLPTTPYV